MTLVELALAGLRLVTAIGGAVADAQAGKITPDEALAKIRQAHGDLALHKEIDAKIDAEMRALYGEPETHE